MQTMTKTLNGAQILIKTLTNLGTDTIFGYPGGIVLNVYDELAKQNDIKHFLVRHEQAAIHAAEGYSRVTGKCGVCLVTSGPGATNIVTGLANAYLDNYPLVAITGQVSAELLHKDAFQEVDILDITKSCTKKGIQVKKASELEKALIDAFQTAMSGRKGPVVVDITKNVFTELAEFSNDFKYNKIETCDIDLYNFKNAFMQAKKPLIIAGLIILGIGGLMFGEINTNIALVDITLPNFVFGLGMIMAMVPMMNLSCSTLTNDEQTNAAGVQNLLKNIGAAIGTSVATTMIARFSQVHQMMMVGHLNFASDPFVQKIGAMTSSFATSTDLASATHMAENMVYNQLLQQSSLWGYVETFRYFGVAAFVIIPLVLLIRTKQAKTE